ncbi:hypothetical protein GHK62_16780 [Sinorhizobium terangae]|uniref:Uncharacterized protein n=1 Tax=Sinorhizobium terangae TaxID=110322 RepID=A0A6N7LF07_SINTE|nr:hypothetical protein [Sinorhizobium terangae]MQX16362.1 hypothetical protein [Sinorhizobium terangae]WFU50447.1 hypothetical protein QA637_27200 [Sinorhizobium terangae]
MGKRVESTEFRLAAQREILVAVLSALAKNDDAWREINRILEEELIVQDHEEDPGIVPSEAFARQNAVTAEISSILQDASARAARGASPAAPKSDR